MYELVGFQFVDIPAKGDDRAIRGHSCWFLVDENDPKFTGRSAVKVFFSDDRYPDFKPQVGDKYLLIFNQKGKLQAFKLLDG